ncbi:MAG: nitrate/nitrite transport system permease protein, partial [Pseudomonadota bacterium]|nr:nitrate/nitrite transport system permease protein [Pseudomonadota bacterium]
MTTLTIDKLAPLAAAANEAPPRSAPAMTVAPAVGKSEEVAAVVAAAPEKVAKAPVPPKAPGRGSELVNAIARAVLPPLIGIAVMIGIWYLATLSAGGSLPGPVQTWHAAVKLFSDPFYSNGPNDQGIGWNVLSSL